MTVISAPLDWVQLVSDLKLPPKADSRLQLLMDRNTEGQLSAEETADLEELVELSETISLVRAEALHLLGEIQGFGGYTVVALTDIGRATIAALDFNHPRRIRVRQVEERFNLFPSDVAEG